MGKVFHTPEGVGRGSETQCQTLCCSRIEPLVAAMLHVPTSQNLAELSGDGKVGGHLLLTMGAEAGFTHMGRCMHLVLCPYSVSFQRRQLL